MYYAGEALPGTQRPPVACTQLPAAAKSKPARPAAKHFKPPGRLSDPPAVPPRKPAAKRASCPQANPPQPAAASPRSAEATKPPADAPAELPAAEFSDSSTHTTVTAVSIGPGLVQQQQQQQQEAGDTVLEPSADCLVGGEEPGGCVGRKGTRRRSRLGLVPPVTADQVQVRLRTASRQLQPPPRAAMSPACRCMR